MIELKQVSINFGTQEVLHDVDLRIDGGEHVGIVGPNGAGKSTLFHLVTGEMSPTKGSIDVERGRCVGHLHQQLHPHKQRDNLFDYACRAIPRLPEIEKELAALQEAIGSAVGDAREKLLRRLGVLQSEYEAIGGYEMEGRVKEALGGLGFSTEDFSRGFSEFSGGWQMRAELARTLSGMPDILLLDEPSNYLDLPAVEWIQRFLREYNGTMLLISHDRYLLRTLTHVTLEVDGGTITRYAGGFDSYIQQREQRYTTLVAAKRNQDKKREKLERFINRFRATSTKASQVQSRIKELDKLEEITVPKQASTAGHLRLPDPPHCGTQAMRLESASYNYDGKQPVFQDVSLEVNRGDRIALVGFNGMGKTTLLRLMAGARAPTSGVRVPGHKVEIGYVSQEFAETMPPERSLLNIIKTINSSMGEREARTLLGSFGFSGEAADKACSVLSGGEKIRLAFARLCAKPPNLLLLDEPTTHLDLNGRRALEDALNAYKGTVCIVSHDVEFVRAVANIIFEISPDGLRRFAGGYDYYREKLSTESSTATQAEEQTGPSDKVPTTNRKALRKQRAEERRRRQPRMKRMKNRMAASEKRSTELEAEQEELLKKLAEATPSADFAMLNKRLRALQVDLKTVNHLWEQAALELEQLETEA